MHNITFSCEVCKTERPSDEIEVFIRSFYFTFGGSMDRNVRYCIDKPECRAGAEKMADEFGEGLGDSIIPLDFCPAGFADIVEGPNTYKTIAGELRQSNVCLAGWNDQDFTHHDVLFALKPRHFGNIQGGIRPEGYLFVSVMRIGAFAFNLHREAPLDPDYVNEKLGGSLGEPVRERLTALINGVMENL